MPAPSTIAEPNGLNITFAASTISIPIQSADQKAGSQKGAYAANLTRNGKPGSSKASEANKKLKVQGMFSAADMAVPTTQIQIPGGENVAGTVVVNGGAVGPGGILLQPPVEPANEEVFCICRQPEAGTMIGCEGCDDWFHPHCFGLVLVSILVKVVTFCDFLREMAKIKFHISQTSYF